MCGRFTQLSASLPELDVILSEESDAERGGRARYNGAPSQAFWVIRRNPETGRYHSDSLFWGLIPHWVKEPDGGRRPINAKSETVSRLPSFRAAYAKRRCIVPIANFFEWRKTTPPKQPYAIAMKDGSPFGLAGIWENWKHPVTDNYIRSFCILTCPANEMIAAIHNRMPVVLPPDAYDRWLSDLEPDPGDLLVPYPAGAMRMWPISTRVNAPRNDDPSILDPLED
jgi:putative SOS response-associated peptidase YedK